MIFDNIEENNTTIDTSTPRSHSLWCERYRPNKLDDVIIPARVRKQIQTFIDGGVTRHILMYGGTGLGKTTIARILTQGHVSKFINASKDNGIDVIRNTISTFGRVASMSNKPKIVVMDEIDNLSQQAALAFRGVMENDANTVRYVATCNYPQNLEKAVRSRFGCKIDFDFKGSEYKEVLVQKVQRIAYICKQEGMTINNDGIKALISKYNDMRDIIEHLQGMYEIGVKEITAEYVTNSLADKYEDFYKIITVKNDVMKIRAFINESYPNQEYNLLMGCGDSLCVWMQKNNHPQLKIANLIYVLADKYKESAIGKPNQFTTLMAFCSELQHYIK